ncbi:MAG: alpha/beta hydrolase [Kiritimatiellae bacterium]|nr:alpha/beta hydrolase [Kiritimatiellia bacterium]
MRNIPVLLLACIAALVSSTGRGATEREYIWPDGKMPSVQRHQIAATTAEVKAPGYKADDYRRPYLDWFDPPAASNKTDVCMILISGGGYYNCCDVALVERWRQKLTAIGITCVSLTYRTPRPEGLPIHQSAWEDGQRAVRVVRSQAAKRGYNPEKIGTISMSAGSHLATLLATSSLTPAYEPVDALDTTTPCHINWAIACAIAYALTDGIGIPNTRNGDAIDVKLDSIFKFDAKTAPMCMFHGGLDRYSPSASTQVYRQLRRMKIPAELHLFAGRGHGFFGNPNKGEFAAGYDNWFGRAAEFIRQMNFDGRLGDEVDLMERYPDDSAREIYSKEDVWPKGKMPDVQTNQCHPYIEWHIPKTLKTTAIQIVYSGGAYSRNKPDAFEVAPVRRYLNAKGMAVVTLKYRTPRPYTGLAKHTTAWQDLQRTVRLVRSQAAAKGLDPNRIGIMGSSAGGHLTLMGVASSRSRSYLLKDAVEKFPCNVQWAVAIYPAYSLSDGVNKPNANGGNEDDSRLVPEFVFDPDTCPTLFIHGDDDVWASMNSVKCWEQMRRMGIQSELHTLALRGHCFQKKASPGTGSYTWLDRIGEFMNQMEIFAPAKSAK